MVNSLALYWNLTPTLQRTGSHCSGFFFFLYYRHQLTDSPPGAAETRLCVNATNHIYSVLNVPQTQISFRFLNEVNQIGFVFFPLFDSVSRKIRNDFHKR